MSLDRAYRETIDYLYALQKHGIKLALSNSFALMSLMGDPHRKFRSVHVAGTNGKGSTSSFIASMLQAGGYRVGLYTSPHLVSFAERIRINNVLITEAKVVELAGRVRDASRKASLNPTFFEVATALAFTYFAEEGVDIAVIEVGMGGRLDSTNVITPLVSVITNIELEHTEFLGTMLTQIAGEKAGVIKQGVPVVTGAMQQEVITVIEQEAAARTAGVYRLSKDFMQVPVASPLAQVFDYRGIETSYEKIRINMLGGYQVDNACLALATIECLRNTGIIVDEAAVRRGLEQARWEGRLELVARKPDIYLDGAHNPASARKLAATVREMKHAYRRTVLIIGILQDKDWQGIIAALAPLADHVVVTKPQYSRAMEVRALASAIRKLHGSVETAETVGEAIALAGDKASSDDLVLITGSLYVVGDARAVFHPEADLSGALTGLKG
ncbi:MAG: bifunctional folylpolyglutamate synthase/dihydrofolate synthase [Nitrospirae bacterium]|nr:bifunctional folylpolyglutamate synthase/dihydrofolate synthase [Nitrospirota bacterium]